MSLISIPAESLILGQTLDFPLRDAEGTLLIGRGQVLRDSPQVHALILRGVWAHEDELSNTQRGTLAPEAPATDFDFEHLRTLDLGQTGVWADLQQRAHALLSTPKAEDFLPRFERLHDEAVLRVRRGPDAALLLLVYDAGQQSPNYSARHALLCLALAELSAQQLGWPEPWANALTRSALCMNVAISKEQDRLALQAEEMDARQREVLNGHGDRAARWLARLGVRQSLWLDAVRLHHDSKPGPLKEREPAHQLARLLGRIDVFAARLSPRRSRRAQSGAAAARAIYLDERRQPDEAGAALVKAVGLYPPGSLVRLASNEIGIVYHRGERATSPRVAALVDALGRPWPSPQARNTSLTAQAVVASLAPHESRLPVDMAALLRL